MTRSFVIAARRTAVVPRGGAFAALDIHQLATPVVKSALQDAGLMPDQVDEIIVSNALGAGGNPARLVALAAGLPVRVAGLSIDRQCCGGLDALILADAMIRSGLHDIVIAGGVESYSRRPLRLKTFADGRNPEPYDQPRFTPWPDRDPDMSVAADHLAHRLGILRADQDAWAMDSHAKALSHSGDLEREIVPVEAIGADSFARRLTLRLCARATSITGDITAANTSVAADAAAFCVLVSERVAGRLAGPIAEFTTGDTVGGDPEFPGLGPVPAIRSVLNKTGLAPEDLAFSEIMEAFAVQAIACQRLTGLPPDRVNQKGGSLARGHPIGASGAILAVRLFHDLQTHKGAGLAAIAAAGGLGTAVVLRSGP